MGRLAQDIQMFGTRRFNLSDPGRDIGYMPSFSWQYMGRNMRPLMETLCWILAAMTATLHEAPPDAPSGRRVGQHARDGRAPKQTAHRRGGGQ